MLFRSLLGCSTGTAMASVCIFGLFDLQALVGGHPYLVRCGLQELAAHGGSFDELEARADHDEGVFSDHLRRLLHSLHQDTELCDVARGLMTGQSCLSAESFYRLRSAGVVTGDSAREAAMRCQLYATYLRQHL